MAPVEPGDLSEKLERCLQRLEPRERKMFLMRYLEGYSHAEIAERFSTTPVNAATIVHRAKKQLRRCLGGR